MRGGHDIAKASRRQLLAGLLAIPLSLVPFGLYATGTPEGALLRDRALFFFDPPRLPDGDPARHAFDRQVPDYRDAVLPLVYHGIGSGTAAEGDLAISPERFGEHLSALRAAGMNFVTAREVAAAFAGGRPLPRNAVMLSFDDGRRDALMWATPLLRQAGAKATMFVITDAADDPAFYYGGWSTLTADPDVWDLQSHTAALHEEQTVADGASLPKLTSRTPGESLGAFASRIDADLDRADRALQARTGRQPVAFAYPFGAWGGDRTNGRRIAGVVRRTVRAHYRLAFHQDDQRTIPLATRSTNRSGVRRLEVGDWSAEELLRRVGASARRTPDALIERPADLLAASGPLDLSVSPMAADGVELAGAGMTGTDRRSAEVRPPAVASSSTRSAPTAPTPTAGAPAPPPAPARPSSPSRPAPRPADPEPSPSPSPQPAPSEPPPSEPEPGREHPGRGDENGKGRGPKR